MLEVREVRKSYGALVAVDGVSFRVGAGETVGLLGPNGAGKTTTVSMLCGVLAPDSGEVLLDGQPIRSDTDPVKRKLGLVPQDLALYPELIARDNLRFFGALYDMRGAELEPAIDAALELVGLTDRDASRVSTFSGGMQRRLNLAAALLHDPQFLLLDEPTVGVDPQSRNAIFENLETLRAAGKSLLYTTHYMEEAERLCDRIVIMDHGRVVASDTPSGLSRLLPGSNRLRIDLEAPGTNGWLEELQRLPGVAAVTAAGERLDVDLQDLTAGTTEVLGWLSRRGLRISHVATERPGLEAVFLHLTGRSLRD
jgi:ABC-2 type transport system ATP-binding protein